MVGFGLIFGTGSSDALAQESAPAAVVDVAPNPTKTVLSEEESASAAPAPSKAVPASDDPTPYQLRGITVNEHLSQVVDPTLTFTDHQGNRAEIGSFFDGETPVILTMNYYSCETLCSVQLNALLDGLKELEWTAGEKFRIVTVSIDEREDDALASAKRQSYLDELGRGGDVDWSFLVGEADQIRALADAVGFTYTYDETTDQFAHPAVITFLSGKGMVSRYLYGIQYPGRDLKFALIETSEGRVGSPVDKIILSCFRYDTTAGRYTATIFGIARLGGVLTVLGLLIAGAIAWRRELYPHHKGA